jgi:hypothetical protein
LRRGLSVHLHRFGVRWRCARRADRRRLWWGHKFDLTGTLGLGNQFGISVSLDGTRLAGGATGDAGATNSCVSCGAVYLFTFTDLAFAGGALAARIGDSYTGGNNINLAGTLGSGDIFGFSVSLDGTRLAVGAIRDNGTTNSCGDCGAVYLFTFTDLAFSGGALAARIGDSYTGGNNINLASTLEIGDVFGASVSLDGTRLAVGAYGDDGATNSCGECGAVYLFTFADLAFSGGALSARIGAGYSGGNNINLASTLGAGDFFGTAVSMDGTRLAVGAQGDDGATNGCVSCGAVYLFTQLSSALPVTLYASTPADSITVTPAALKTLLDAGTAVVLQANNDITLNSSLTIANGSGPGGTLTLQAGRSVLLNANITTDDGNLTIIANDLLANGVVDAYRDAGAAAITMAPGASINTGAGTVTIQMRDGAGKTFSTGGIITLSSITASSILATNASLANGDIVLQSGTVLTGNGTGDAVVLVAGDQFINNAGAGAIKAPNGRFLVYSQDWNIDTRGGLTGNNLYNRTFAGNPPASISQIGNLFVYALQPILTVTASDASRAYGAANPAFTAMIAGLINGDTAAYAYSGAPEFSTTTTPTSNVGIYAGDILPNIGSLLSSVGYGFSFVAGDLTINAVAPTAEEDSLRAILHENMNANGIAPSSKPTELQIKKCGTVVDDLPANTGDDAVIVCASVLRLDVEVRNHSPDRVSQLVP